MCVYVRVYVYEIYANLCEIYLNELCAYTHEISSIYKTLVGTWSVTLWRLSEIYIYAYIRLFKTK